MILDRNSDPIKQGDSFFYDDDSHDTVWMCRLDGDLIFCSSLDDYDKVYSFYTHEFRPERALLG